MATPKLDATLRLEISRWLPLAADTDIRNQDDWPFPKCRENGPSLTSPETSREYEGARCCPHSGCHAFPGLRSASFFLFPRLPRRSPLSDWLIEPNQFFFPGQKVVQQLVLFWTPPPKPADWTAESDVTRLPQERGRANQELGVFYKLGKWLLQNSSQGESEEVGATLRASGEGAAHGSWRE